MSSNLAVSTINGVDISVSPVATQAFATGQDLGVGQTWQNVTGSRVSGTTYTNSSVKPISVSVSNNATSGNNGTVVVGGVTILVIAEGTDSNQAINFIVPNNTTYSVTLASIANWSELR